MIDCNAQTLRVGDKCVVVRSEDRGKTVWVHRVGSYPGQPKVPAAQVFDAPHRPDFDMQDKDFDRWTFCGWLKSKDLAKVKS